jgi:integrase/recombinase XerC
MQLIEPRTANHAELVSSFLSGRSAATLRTYTAGLEDFRLYVKAATVAAAAAELLGRGAGEANRLALAYRADLIERKLAPATINNRLAALRSMAKLAAILGIVPYRLEVPSVRAEAYRDTTGPGQPAVRRMIDNLAADPRPKARRDAAIVRLLHDTALRRAEVAGLDLSDLDAEAGAVFVVRKGRREKVRVNLPGPTLAALRSWVEARGSAAGPLFTNLDRASKGSGRLTGTSLYRLIRGLGLEAGVKTRPHGLRHAGITKACEAAAAAGIGLEEVLAYSGHANVRTLMIYRDKTRDMQGRLAALVAGE